MADCCIIGCDNKAEKRGEVKFYTLPTAKSSRPQKVKRRRLWLDAIEKANGTKEGLGQDAQVCSAHFISGQMSLEMSDPDFVPSVFPKQHSAKSRRKTLRPRSGVLPESPKVSPKKRRSANENLDQPNDVIQTENDYCEPLEDEEITMEKEVKKEIKEEETPQPISSETIQYVTLKRLKLQLKPVVDDCGCFRCDLCDGKFPTGPALLKHKQLHEQEWSDEDETLPLVSDFEIKSEYIESPLEDPSFQCNMCSRSFPGAHSLKRHKLLHVRDSRKCPLCGTMFCKRHNHVVTQPQISTGTNFEDAETIDTNETAESPSPSDGDNLDEDLELLLNSDSQTLEAIAAAQEPPESPTDPVQKKAPVITYNPRKPGLLTAFKSFLTRHKSNANKKKIKFIIRRKCGTPVETTDACTNTTTTPPLTTTTTTPPVTTTPPLTITPPITTITPHVTTTTTAPITPVTASITTVTAPVTTTAPITTITPHITTTTTAPITPRTATIAIFPRFTTTTASITNNTPRITTVTPRITTVTPRITTITPRITTITPRTTTITPRIPTCSPCNTRRTAHITPRTASITIFPHFTTVPAPVTTIAPRVTTVTAPLTMVTPSITPTASTSLTASTSGVKPEPETEPSIQTNALTTSTNPITPKPGNAVIVVPTKEPKTEPSTVCVSFSKPFPTNILKELMTFVSQSESVNSTTPPRLVALTPKQDQGLAKQETKETAAVIKPEPSTSPEKSTVCPKQEQATFPITTPKSGLKTSTEMMKPPSQKPPLSKRTVSPVQSTIKSKKVRQTKTTLQEPYKRAYVHGSRPPSPEPILAKIKKGPWDSPIPNYPRVFIQPHLPQTPELPPELQMFSPQLLTSATLEVHRNFDFILSK